jgi:hypothetical protein
MTTSRRPRVLLASALLGMFCAASAGCGGGNDTTAAATKPSTKATKPLTKAQFVKEANAICHKTGLKKDHLLAEAEKESGKPIFAASPSEQGQLIETVVLPVFMEGISELRELTPPPREKARVARIVEIFERAREETEADPAHVVGHDPFLKADRAVEAYGLQMCSVF